MPLMVTQTSGRKAASKEWSKDHSFEFSVICLFAKAHGQQIPQGVRCAAKPVLRTKIYNHILSSMI